MKAAAEPRRASTPRTDRTTELEASEKNFREIFEEAPIGMAVIALDERFLQVNARFCQMVGYTETELIKRTAEDITYHEDIEVGRQLAHALLDGKERYTGEKRYVHKSGEVLWVSRTACLVREKEGTPHHFILMVEDISERKRTERKLLESRRELEAALHANQLIMDNSLDVICTTDDEGRFLSVNPACVQLWGYMPAELVGRKFIEFVHPDDHANTQLAFEQLLARGKITDFVNRYVRKDASVVDVLWSVTWSAADRLVFGVAHDVTERSRTEKALREAKDEADRANHAKSEFLSRMSHELRTPLNAILGFGQLIESQQPTGSERTRVRHILTAGRHLLNLINEVLDISRIEAGNFQLPLEPVCLEQALGEALELMRPLAAERSIDLLAPIVRDVTTYILADRQRLKQVLLNLLGNAVKYTPLQGTVTVSFNETGTNGVRILVSDSGPGIAADKLARLFTPFDRLGAEQSAVEGTGLGLALSQRLVDAMHGSIGVQSTPGSGSEFWVELPSAQSPLERLSAQKQNVARVKGILPAQKRKVLYIEDNFSNVTLVEEMLADQPGLELITSMQGSVGLDLARQHVPDLILLDLHLPDLPGWEVLAHLKRGEATRHIPVVVISADATARQINRLMAAGATAYLTKPLDLKEFFQVVADATNSTCEARGEAAA